MGIGFLGFIRQLAAAPDRLGWVPLILVPLLALSAGAWVYGRAKSASREAPRVANRHLLATVLGLAADAVLLAALPSLGLSFGPPALTWTILALGRTGLLLAGWMALPVATRHPRGSSFASVLGIAAQLLISAAVVYGFYIEPFRLQTTLITVPAPQIPTGQSLRIVQLSDLHIERITQRERELVGQVNALQPDLIVITGDHLNLSYLHDPQAEAGLRWLVSQLQAEAGIYAVNGTVETPERAGELFANTGVTVLADALHPISTDQGELLLVGLSNIHTERDAARLGELMADRGNDPPLFTVLLYHTPDLIPDAAAAPIDLYLAGHTHGGQIRLPLYGAVFTASAFGKRYEAGRYQEGQLTAYVSRGIGLEGSFAPRARFLCPPEIVVVDLVGGAPMP